MTGGELVTALLDEAFAPALGRDPRSEEYRLGVRDALLFRARVMRAYTCPYCLGTAPADAWFAGVQEGHRIWREHEAKGHPERDEWGFRADAALIGGGT